MYNVHLRMKCAVPGIRGCPVIPMGGILKLFMAAQAFGSDIGIAIELESIVMLQIPSVEISTKMQC